MDTHYSFKSINAIHETKMLSLYRGKSFNVFFRLCRLFWYSHPLDFDVGFVGHLSSSLVSLVKVVLHLQWLVGVLELVMVVQVVLGSCFVGLGLVFLGRQFRICLRQLSNTYGEDIC